MGTGELPPVPVGGPWVVEDGWGEQARAGGSLDGWVDWEGEESSETSRYGEPWQRCGSQNSILRWGGGGLDWKEQNYNDSLHHREKKVLVPYTWEGGPVLKTHMSGFLVLMSQEGRLFPPNWTPLATWNIIWETRLMPYPSHMLCPGPKCHFPHPHVSPCLGCIHSHATSP